MKTLFLALSLALLKTHKHRHPPFNKNKKNLFQVQLFYLSHTLSLSLSLSLYFYLSLSHSLSRSLFFYLLPHTTSPFFLKQIMRNTNPLTGQVTAKLLDFGLSKNAGAGSSAKTFVGTPCYLGESLRQVLRSRHFHG